MYRFGPTRTPQGLRVGKSKKEQNGVRSRIILREWSVGPLFASDRMKRGLVALLIELMIITPLGAALPQMALASTGTYHASVHDIAMTFDPGQTKTLTVKFTNDGTATWIGDTAHTAFYLYGASSIFHNGTWLKSDMPSVVSPAIVKPGQIGAAVFSVTAPSTPGTYHERFLLSYGPDLWMKGSVLNATFTVNGSATASSVSTVTSASSNVAPSSASDAWKAELTDKGGIEWQTHPGGLLTAMVAFKNRGTQTWTSEGGNPVWMTTPAGTKSAFEDNSWENSVQAAPMQEGTVRPGGIAHFLINLRAPTTVGDHNASFELAAGLSPDHLTRIANSTVTFPIHVVTSGVDVSSNTSNGTGDTLTDTMATPTVPAGSDTYQALLLLSSSKNVALSGNGRQQLTYGFKNVGTSKWTTLSLRPATTGIATDGVATPTSVRDDSWLSSTEPVRINAPTLPGQIGFVTFTIKVPPKKGQYVASFTLMADEQPVQDGTIMIPITVTADGYIEPDTNTNTNTNTTQTNTQTDTPGTVINVQPLGGDMTALPDEPIIRVGLFQTTDDQTMLTALSGQFYLKQGDKTICSFSAGEVVTIHFDRTAKVYKATGPRCTSQSTDVYYAVAADGISPIVMTDFSRPVSWLPGANDNKFRGKVELRYTPATDAVWTINELPIEWYLKGIGETSNSSPQEYQKALLTAARTYAMYHVMHGTKHANEDFTVDATYDQVYRGYGAEARDPNVVTAVDATRGQIVTYNGKLAITPYYSRSDGRTRDWTEVWGGSGIPWLVSVKVPWDVGKTLWGHGVGMSATGALGAAADGWDYNKILTYFYTGTVLMRAYK